MLYIGIKCKYWEAKANDTSRFLIWHSRHDDEWRKQDERRECTSSLLLKKKIKSLRVQVVRPWIRRSPNDEEDAPIKMHYRSVDGRAWGIVGWWRWRWTNWVSDGIENDNTLQMKQSLHIQTKAWGQWVGREEWKQCTCNAYEFVCATKKADEIIQSTNVPNPK